VSNRTEIAGLLTESGPVRYTPAGIPVIEFTLQHESEITEADVPRKVSATLCVQAFGALARQMSVARLGMQVQIVGFLAARNRRSSKIVLHATEIQFEEGVR